jgi:3-hydroxyacyl-[acyl-carrier-protein] dehydratase
MRGIKNVAMTEDFLEFHFPGNPIMPGVLLLEALCQLAGWLEAASSDFEMWFLPNHVTKCSFYGFALPGDQVELEIEMRISDKPEVRSFRGIGTVKGKKKIVAEFEGQLVPLEAIQVTEEQRRFFALLTRDARL